MKQTKWRKREKVGEEEGEGFKKESENSPIARAYGHQDNTKALVIVD